MFHPRWQSTGRCGVPAVNSLCLGSEDRPRGFATGHPQIYGLSFSPDGRSLVTVGWDSIIRLWETETGRFSRDIKVADHAIGGDLRMYAVRHAPDGDLIATAHLDGTVRLWQSDPLKLRRSFQVPGRFIFGAIAFSPDGLWLATGSMDGSVNVWDALGGNSVWNVGRHQHYVYTLGFGRDIRSLVTGGSDGLCYLWDLRPPGWRSGGRSGPALARPRWGRQLGGL